MRSNLFLLFVMLSVSPAAGSAPLRLPTVAPKYCAGALCMSAKGPYSVSRYLSSTDFKGERQFVHADFEDGTRLSVEAFRTRRADCQERRKWRLGKNVATVTYCTPTDVGHSSRISFIILAASNEAVRRYMIESDLCAWTLSHPTEPSRALSAKTCVGDRIGLAIP